MDAKSTDLSSSAEENFKYPRVHYWQLMKYSSKLEIFLLIFGIIMSCLVGSSMPISFLLFSDLINEFISETGPQFTMLTTLIESFSILGAATFVVAFLQMFCLKLASKMQARRIKLLFYNMILRQDVAWFDEQNVGQLITRLTEGIDKIESGIGEKLGIFVQYILIFVSGIIVGFTKNWKLSLVACSIFPLVVISCGSLSIVVRKFSTRERAAYSKANGIAGEVLGAIRTIFAFEGQEKELKRYEAELGTAEKLGIIRSSVVGSVFGFTDFSIYILIAVTFWYGVEMLAMNESNPGDIILVVFAMLFGSATLGQSFQQFDHFNFAKEAASEIFYIIDRTPPIDKQAPGIVIDDLKGEIEFKNVSFQYPMRTDVTVLQHFDLKMKGGQTVAIVGPSGSGKSTVVQLIQRFYNCTEGSITIDGIDLTKLDLKWFRSRLGVVCQEPLLFAGTVAENIRLGKLDATQEEIEEAAKLAEAHDFISKLPEAYDTFIAESGGGMSGGQKQRIAIARALIRDPRILLLDEATSALDTRSEQAVQLALNKAKSGRTVVIVAHRLSTVRDADVIMVVDRGEIVESGTHDELMSINGIYCGLVKKSGSDESEAAVAEETDEEEKEISESLRKASFSLKKKAFSETGSVVSLGSSLSWKSDDFFVTEAKISASKEVMRLNKPEWIYLTIGALMAVVSGVVQSGFTLVYTEMYDIFSETDMSEMRSRAQFIAGLMTGLGFMRLLGMTLSGFCLGVAGERLTKRCRVLVFEAILNQEIGWFDEPENQPGSLTGRLAADVPMLQNVSGKRLGSIIETLVLIICSLFIGFYFSWQITLVALAFFPVLMIAGAFQMQQWTGGGDQVNMKGAGLAHETLSAARTVFSLGAEEYFSQRYVNEALVDNKKILISALTFSSVSALANSLMNFEFAAAFYAGGKLMERGELTMLQVFRAYTAISFGAQNLGVAASYAPDTKKAGVAAKGLFQILRRTPLLQRNEGEFPSKEFQGNLTFDKVDFRYPTRRKIKVLKHFTYDVPLGKSVALVGQSGCGKSTVLQLVQRFYDVSHTRNSNCISIDGIDISSLAPNWIRRQIGVVSQEPNLLDLSIRENIAYGMNFQEVSMGAIIDAAKQANAHNFILQLPAGYDTEVGPRGSQLSGGQKQRIAIARALLRNPRLLLLDEATAALDNESEGVVQEALDEAMKKGLRTTLVVAHRLTTVKKCDLIVVLENGRVIESGSPAELMSKKGAYYALNNSDIHVEH